MFLRNINVEYVNMEQYDLRPGGCKERPVLPLCLSFIVFVSACLKVETHSPV